MFDLYDKCDFGNAISFSTFYVALLVFNELKLIKIDEGDGVTISINKDKKSELNLSKIYRQILEIKDVFREEKNGGTGNN